MVHKTEREWIDIIHSVGYSRHGIKKIPRTRFWGASRAAFRVRKTGLRTRFALARKIASRTQIAYAKSRRVRKSRT